MTTPLVSAHWLAERLCAPGIQIVDVRTQWNADGSFNGEPARDAYRLAHIPGAIYVDLANEVNDSSGLPFTLLAADSFRSVVAQLGIDSDKQVVIYDQGVDEEGRPAPSKWAARLWWQLRAEGFASVSVLDEGLAGWIDRGLPTSSGVETAGPASVDTVPGVGWFANFDDVAAAITAPEVTLIDSREHERYLGRTPMPYGTGHVPTAVHSALDATLVDGSARVRRIPELIEHFDRVVPGSGAVITYCGGGVSAAWNAFALYLAGRRDVAVYDGSMSEWGPAGGALTTDLP